MAHSLDTAEAVDVPAQDTEAALEDIIAESLGGDDEEELETEPEGKQPEGDETDEDPEDDGEDTDDEGDDDGDDEPETAIEPPASMTAEEKQAFAQLPMEAQQLTKQFAARREQEVHTGLEKAKTAQQDVQRQAAASIAEAKQSSAQEFMTLANAYAPQAPDPALAQHNAAQYIAEKAQYDAQIAQHEQIMQYARQQYSEGAQEIEAAEQQSIQREWEQVIDEIPEARDQAKFAELLQTLTPVAIALGYSEDIIPHANPTDIRAMKRVADKFAKADKWDALQARKMQGVRAGKTAKANPAQPTRSGNKAQKVEQRLRGGNDADLRAYIETIT